jgi:hypothetical protein
MVPLLEEQNLERVSLAGHFRSLNLKTAVDGSQCG